MRNLPERHSIRLSGFDYSRMAVYFITIDTDGRIPIFGKICKDAMILNDFGKIAEKCWLDIPKHFPAATLNEYIVMPNHIHGLIGLTGEADTVSIIKADTAIINKTDTACRVPTDKKNKIETFSKPTVRSIPTIIRSFKSAVTKLMHEQFPGRYGKIWQPRYYEHIVRSERELNAIIDYIRANPANWNVGTRHAVSAPHKPAVSATSDQFDHDRRI
jgi:putative transposase